MENYSTKSVSRTFFKAAFYNADKFDTLLHVREPKVRTIEDIIYMIVNDPMTVSNCN